MIITLHVIVALASIGLTSYAYVLPSTSKLRIAYSLAGLTVASGMYLVWSAPAHMLQACTIGVAYIGVVSLGILAVKRKLVIIENSA